MHHHATRAGGQRFGMGLKKNNNFKMSAGGGYDPMNFSASQIPDNPGYMDFSDPTPPPLQQNVKNVVAKKPGQQQRPQQLQHQQPQPQQQQQQPSLGTRNSQRNKKAGVKNKPARNNNNNMNNNNNNINNNSNDMNNTNNNNMNNNNNNNNKRIKRNWPKTKFNGPVGQNNGGGGFKGQNGDGPRVPNRLRGPQNMGGRGRMAPPIPFLPPHAFRTPPLIPPIPHMGRGPLPPPMGVQQLPPPFMRRNARGRPLPMPHPPLPQAMLPPMGRMTRSGGPPHNGGMHFNGGGGLGGKIPKQNIKSIKKVVKGKSSIKTLKNIVNQYPLTKPWVTDEIRAEHAKKVTIEKSLVGNKNDELFAQFKVQRDKFVQLYEAARENHVKTESSNDKPKDAKTQAIVNQTTEPDANCSNAEAIASN